MAEKIKIDIVSDVVCPWCILGYQRLQAAIDELGISDNIEIEWQPFQLNPNVPKEGVNLHQHLMKKYGMLKMDSDRNRQQLIKLGLQSGYAFNFFEEMKTLNTRDAHILLAFAKSVEKQTALKTRLFDAYFKEQQDISDRTVLSGLLIEVGIDAEKAMAQLDDQEAQQAFDAENAYWKELGVSSVPTFVFNRESAVSGAQPVETLKQILQELTP
ncbi:thioredoxin [Enterovibrio norvegicus]|uniref:DsbA family oxidoreductase n=1 Tax=Enterovibrio norvegicus TaxID=188144 RepID=UPI0002F07B3C|nr:DsbA family oxidoreductase [Enterovibrio norvegicus]OEE47070.1 thioredoxin [Enterovibrio norvegicus]OEF62183.1 thioredoxin [Enterovibrio norvegicus]